MMAGRDAYKKTSPRPNQGLAKDALRRNSVQQRAHLVPKGQPIRAL